MVRARDKVARELPSAHEILRGSLLRRTIRHRRGCAKCERGEGHPVWVLTAALTVFLLCGGAVAAQDENSSESRRESARELRQYIGQQVGGLDKLIVPDDAISLHHGYLMER